MCATLVNNHVFLTQHYIKRIAKSTSFQSNSKSVKILFRSVHAIYTKRHILCYWSDGWSIQAGNKRKNERVCVYVCVCVCVCE